MKKKLCIGLIAVCSIFYMVQTSFAYTANFTLDSSLDFSLIDGLDVTVSGINDPLTDLTLTVYYNSEDGAVPGDSSDSSWDAMLTSYGVNLFSFDALPLAESDQLQEGLVFSLEATTEFGIESFELLSSEDVNGYFSSIQAYQVLMGTDLDGSITYTAAANTNAAPIPSAILLLGGGLFGMLGIRRKIK